MLKEGDLFDIWSRVLSLFDGCTLCIMHYAKQIHGGKFLLRLCWIWNPGKLSPHCGGNHCRGRHLETPTVKALHFPQWVESTKDEKVSSRWFPFVTNKLSLKCITLLPAHDRLVLKKLTRTMELYKINVYFVWKNWLILKTENHLVFWSCCCCWK